MQSKKPPTTGRIGVDIGGTFTDVVLEYSDRRFVRKILTIPDNPARACLQGMTSALQEAGASPGEIGTIIHGTTLATNAVIERKGAVTSLVTTAGFRDTIEIGTEGRPDQYDINIIKPEPLVPRRRRFCVQERLDRNGNVLIPLQDRDLEALLPALDDAGTESLAIGFLHSYVNSEHERRAGDFFVRRRPLWSISLSSDISPEFREYERFSTTCTNAYVQPLVAGYLDTFREELRRQGFTCPLFLMLSNGGLTSVEIARRFPVRLIESGPAGGAIFASVVAERCGVGEAISFDMGGTTAKICMVDGAEIQTSRQFEVARVYRFRKDSGLPIRIPVIDMVEIGAGGGSIAGIDELGRLSVGPESAGAEPGPACYGTGGDRPTVTDANLLLGYVDPDNFAGGDIALESTAAERMIQEQVAEPLGLESIAAAFGITEIVSENMSSAARVHAIENGKNSAGRTLIAFGGAAPLQACQMADRLGIDRIIIPNNAGVGSAVGFLRAPISFELVKTVYQPLDGFDAETTNRICGAMVAEAKSNVISCVGEETELVVRRHAYMRYSGQGHEIPVEVPWRPFDEDSSAMLQRCFDDAYRRAFGRNVGGVAQGEIVSWSISVSAPRQTEFARDQIDVNLSPSRQRYAFDRKCRELIRVKVVDREELKCGEQNLGPTIISEQQTSIVVPPGFSARRLATADIELFRLTGLEFGEIR